MERERILGHPLPAKVEVGAMPGNAQAWPFAPDLFFQEGSISCRSGAMTSSSSFSAADRENETGAQSANDTLNLSFPNLDRTDRPALRTRAERR